MFLEFLAFTIIIFFILLELKRLQLSFRLRHIPGPTEIPFIGCKYIISTNKITGDLRFSHKTHNLFKFYIFSDIESLCYEVCVEKTVKLFVLHRVALITSDCKLLKIILTDKSCIDRPYIFEFLDLDYGLTSSKCKKQILLSLNLNKLTIHE